ncbi:methyltransferase domain-containing protein [Methylobacter sp. G7]|uniref:class I SAM-dependent methyltransferase n=1 Tax=Methylobacter sp. G7 TaxID=3230117 RepID=UPI003D806B1A
MILPTTPLQAAWNWSLSSLYKQNRVKKISDTESSTHYPIKLLRYWFMYHLIKEEQVRLGRPLRVCEIGVDRGQMRRYMQDAGFTDIACWEAVDYKLQPELMESGYTKQIQANVDLPDFNLAEKYDVIIVLHLLEHLFKPEQLASKLSSALVPRGVLIGGFPTVPQLLQAYRQKKIRLTAANFGHVSTFSPQRVKNMAKSCGLSLDFLSGTYFLRKRNFSLENFKGWVRVNLFWGILFPALGAEIYWLMRK